MPSLSPVPDETATASWLRGGKLLSLDVTRSVRAQGAKKPPRRRDYAFLIPVAVALVVLVLVTEEVVEKELFPWDRDFLTNISGLQSPLLDIVFGVATIPGGGFGILLFLIPLVAFLLARDRLTDAMFVVVGVFGARVATAVMKDVLNRPRPTGGDTVTVWARPVTLALVALMLLAWAILLWRKYRRPRPVLTSSAILSSIIVLAVAFSALPDVFGPSRQSFPSGHATASMALALAAGALAWGSRVRYLAIGLGALYVAVVGLSRVYFGVHYPSDVLAGWAVSVVWVALTWIAFKPWLEQHAQARLRCSEHAARASRVA